MRFGGGLKSSGLGLLLLASAAPAQVPGTDLYSVELQAGEIPTGAIVRNLTAREGYDNQPAFLPDSSALRYTVIDADGQADIWLLPLPDGEARRLTLTDDTSEYSATPIPGDSRFSVVRVEPDSTQRLWSFAADGSAPRLLLDDVAPVGYHAWGDGGDLVLFVLGSPHSLHRARAGQAGSTPVVGDIGRCLQRIPGEQAWSFPLADDEAGWVITRLDAATGDLAPIAAAPAPSVQDYCWSPSGELWSSDGSRILRWDAGGWTLAADLADQGIASISRMAIAPDGSSLVFVAADPPPRLSLEGMARRGGIPAAVARYLRALNAGDEDSLRAFVTEHRDAESLERTPPEVRVDRQLQIRGMVGALEPVREVAVDEAHYLLVVKSEKTGGWFELQFVASSTEPVRFSLMGMRPAQDPATADIPLEGDLDALLPQLLAAHRIPGMAVAMAGADGRVVSCAAGERRSGEEGPIADADAFHFGSITKSMTAYLAARLVDRRSLRFDTTLHEVLDGIWMHSGFRKVTLEQLLRHRAGVEPLLEPDAAREARWREVEDPVQRRRKLVAEVLAVEPDFAPGTAMLYSNAGYVVAGHVLETVAGRPFEVLLEEELSGPLGLESFGTGWPSDDGPAPEGHWPGPVPQDPRAYRVGAELLPAGDVHGSAADLARFGRALVTGEGITPESRDALLDDGGTGYALGIGREEIGGVEVAAHGGSAGTFHALLVCVPADGRSIAVLCNEGSMANEALAREIAAALLEGTLRIGD